MSGSEAAPRAVRTPEELVEALGPEFAPLEELRAGILGKRKRGSRILVIAGLVCGVLALAVAAATNSPGQLPIMALLAGGVPFAITGMVVYASLFSGGKESYKHAYKRRIVAGMVKALEPGMDYRPHEGLSLDWFRSARLYKEDIDRYHSEDLFIGRVGETELMFAEVHAEDKRTSTDSKGNTRTYYVTVFQGLFVVADFHKHFRSEVVVMPDFAERNFGWVGRKLQGLAGKVERMESPEFEKAFVVRASDAVEARYILTPDMQDRMLDLRRRLGEDVRFAFRDSNVFLTVPISADWFEPSLDVPARNLGQVRTLAGQIAAVFRIVEDLNLNTRIWTKD